MRIQSCCLCKLYKVILLYILLIDFTYGFYQPSKSKVNALKCVGFIFITHSFFFVYRVGSCKCDKYNMLIVDVS